MSTCMSMKVYATLLAVTSIMSGTPWLAGTDGSRGIHAQRADTIVRRIGQPVHGGVATLVEEVSIGAAAGPPEQTFSSIAEIAIGPDGSVFVLDRPAAGTPFLRQYDAAGRFLRTIGRAGDGPGEYRAPSGLAVLRDGRVLLRGGANHRINVYDHGGEPLASWRLNETGTYIAQNVIVVDTGGTIWVRTPPRFLRTGTRLPPQFTRLTSAGALVDTVLAPEMPNANPPSLSAQSGNASVSLPVPYTSAATFALSPLGYFVTGVSSRYAIELRVPPRRPGPPAWRVGDPVISLRRERVPSVPVPDAERDARREDIETRLRRTDPSWRWSGMDIPRVKPPFTSFRVANDGRIWVLTSQPSERFDPDSDATTGASISISGAAGGGGGGAGAPRQAPPPPVPWRSPAVYDVLEPDGRWIGQVRIPYGVTAHVMQGDHVWASTSNEDGVPYVKRYRIAWGGP